MKLSTITSLIYINLGAIKLVNTYIRYVINVCSEDLILNKSLHRKMTLKILLVKI